MNAWRLSAAWMTAGMISAAAMAASPATSQPDATNPRVTPVVLAYKKARPAVVSIFAEKVITTSSSVFGGDPFEDIFPTPARRLPVQSLGSGVILHAGGYIVTNAHVVRCAEKITVTLSDKSTLPAKIVIADSDHDIAVLKVEPPKGSLPFLPLGRSDDLMVGEPVIAIGNPMGYANSVTTGVISAVDRTMDFGNGLKYAGLIQTDAPINPGNSGGPLLNANGELIGMNTAIRADAQNIGFAIPAAELTQQIAALLDFERINRVTFGAAITVRMSEAGEEIIVGSVRKGTPADGVLKTGDRLVSLNGQPIRQVPDYSCAMLAAKPDEKLTFKVLRDGKELAAELALKTRPKPDGQRLSEGLLGATFKPITPQLTKDMGLLVDCGLVITGLDEGGPAGKLGFKVKDVIFQIDRFLVSDYSDLGSVLEDVRPGQTLRMGFVRKNVRGWVPLKTREPKSAPASLSQPAGTESSPSKEAKEKEPI